MKKIYKKKEKMCFDESIPYGIKQHSFITILHYSNTKIALGHFKQENEEKISDGFTNFGLS